MREQKNSQLISCQRHWRLKVLVGSHANWGAMLIIILHKIPLEWRWNLCVLSTERLWLSLSRVEPQSQRNQLQETHASITCSMWYSKVNWARFRKLLYLSECPLSVELALITIFHFNAIWTSKPSMHAHHYQQQLQACSQAQNYVFSIPQLRHSSIAFFNKEIINSPYHALACR